MITNIATVVTSSPPDVVLFNLVKKHLRIDVDFIDEDTLIQSYIDSSVVYCENFIGGHITNKTVTISANGFDNPFCFDDFPIRSITSVKYLPGDVTASLVTMLSADYMLSSKNNKDYMLNFYNSLPATRNRFDAVSIVYEVGYTELPKPLLQAILLFVGAMYENREDETKTTFQRVSSACNLLYAYKKY